MYRPPTILFTPIGEQKVLEFFKKNKKPQFPNLNKEFRRIETLHRNFLQIMWVAGVKYDDILKYKSKFTFSYNDDYKIVEEISQASIDYLLGNNIDYEFHYLSEEEIYVLYSMRRAIDRKSVV